MRDKSYTFKGKIVRPDEAAPELDKLLGKGESKSEAKAEEAPKKRGRPKNSEKAKAEKDDEQEKG